MFPNKLELKNHNKILDFAFRIYRRTRTTVERLEIELEMASLMSSNMPRMKLSDEIWEMIDTILKRKHNLRKMIFGRTIATNGGLHKEYNIAPSQSLELTGFKRKLEKFLDMTDSKERDISVSIVMLCGITTETFVSKAYLEN